MGIVVYIKPPPPSRRGLFGNNPDLSRMGYIEAAVWAYEPKASASLQFDVSLDGSRSTNLKSR